MREIARTVESGLNSTRRLSAASGAILLLVLGVLPDGNLASRVAVMAWVILAFATAAGWLQLVSQERQFESVVTPVENNRRGAWILVTIAVVVAAGIATQTWFRPGTTLAGGDDVVPNGTAWIGRLFEPWVWGGSTLGEPSQLPMALPRAAILGLTHALGADPGIAHRILESSLFIGAGLGALGLLASLRIGPVAALVGSMAYLFNPYVVTVVSPHDVYLATLCVLPAIPAALVAAGSGRLSVWWSAVIVASTSPLIGYAFFTPPLVGMILAAALSAPLVVAWVYGRPAARRCLRALLLAVPLLVLTSAYWTFPAIVRLGEAHLNSSGISLGFNWIGSGEIRDTIRNAFWLNTRWMWIAPEYFPYANVYEDQPLSALRFVLPAGAFSSLALARLRRDDRRPRRDRSLRLAVALATVALILIFLSTGTNPPGNVIFDPLYKLPFGWLLQEPERFLMVAALVYGLLIAVVVQEVVDHQSVTDLINSRRLKIPALRLAIVPLALGTAVMVAFPLYSGVLVPDTGRPLPVWANNARPQHVHVPAYWSDMAQFADALPLQGAVLVMPPDDFYEMPYTWYYGSDAFIAELFQRHVLVPSYPPSPLVDAVNMTAQSILRHDWPQSEALVRTLDAPLILVRGDIVVPFTNHSIVPPNDLAAALSGAPNFALVRHVGSLDLFALRGPVAETELQSNFVMINTRTPDLGLLPLVSRNGALVSGVSRPGVPFVVQSPPLELWQAKGDTLIWQPPAPSGFSYRVAELASKSVVRLSDAGTYMTTGSQIVYAPGAPNDTLTVSVTTRPMITNGDFTTGDWGPVVDCHALAPTQARPSLEAHVVSHATPNGLPALRISASLDSACEAQDLAWHGGAIVLNVMMKHIQGAAPEVCLYEVGPDRCASLPAVPDMSDWFAYRVSVSPDVGTKAITLVLYADASEPGIRTINEYADVRALEVSGVSTFALLADPNSQPTYTTQLLVVHSTFSSQWQGPTNSQHVLVDGMLNGWLIPTGSKSPSIYYKPAFAFGLAEQVSLATYVLLLVWMLWPQLALFKGRKGRLKRSDESERV